MCRIVVWVLHAYVCGLFVVYIYTLCVVCSICVGL